MDNKGAAMDKMPSTPSLNGDILNTSSTLKLAENDVIQKNAKNVSMSKTTLDFYDPFSHREVANPTSTIGAVVHLLKSSLGSGILAMPLAFKHGGLIFGLIGTVIVGLICTHCVNLLVYCSQLLASRAKRPSLGFAETAEVAFQTGPEKFRKFACFAKEFVRASLFATYYLGNTVYVVFIATSFHQVISSRFDFEMSIRLYILLLSIPLVPLGIIRTLGNLVPFTASATVFILFGLAITLYFTFLGLPDITTSTYVASPSQWPLFFSTVLFAMEGIGTVLPIEHSMRTPQHFLGCPGVLNFAMTVVVCVYATVGFFGYLRYGDATEGSITLNLPTDNVLAEVVKILVALSVLFTYGLQFSVPSEIMWSTLGPKLSEKWQESGYYLMRGMMIMGTVVIAIIVPDLGPIISLVGAVCFSILGLLCPAVIEIVTLRDEGYGTLNWRLYKDYFLIFISILALVFGTYSSLQEIIETYTG